MWEKTISCTSISPDAAFAGVRKLSHIQKAIHDDSGKSKACSGFHFAASQSGAQKIAHMERQQKVDGIAPGHGAQQAAALGVFINADELFPPEQAEHMPQQHQCRGGKQQ